MKDLDTAQRQIDLNAEDTVRLIFQGTVPDQGVYYTDPFLDERTMSNYRPYEEMVWSGKEVNIPHWCSAS